MPQPGFLYRAADGVTQRDKLHVTYKEHQRAARDLGFGTLMQGTGKYDRQTFVVYDGRGADYVPATAADLKKHVRRLRPQEAEQLESLDQEILATEQRLKDLRAQRQDTLREAFQRGHVVQVQEARAVADAALARKNTEG